MKNCLYLLLLVALITSCVPQKQIVYLQSPDDKAAIEYKVDKNRDLKIEPGDILYINIGTVDGNAFNFFSHEKSNFNSVSETSLSVLGHTVTDSGYVLLPVIGKMKLQGLTLQEASNLIKEATKSVITDPIVSIRFVNNSVTVLGEVLKPGTYMHSNQQLTIFRAIGLAGDISEYGNRKKVILIRENKGVIHKYQLDLTKDDILKSDYYYLRPNDVIYVEPLKIRRFGMKEYPFSLIVSSVTAFFLILYYLKR